jgi:hypothetical protein
MYSIADIMERAGIPIEEIAKDVRMDVEMANFMEENANRGLLYRLEIKRICMEPDKIDKLWFDKE